MNEMLQAAVIQIHASRYTSINTLRMCTSRYTVYVQKVYVWAAPTLNLVHGKYESF